MLYQVNSRTEISSGRRGPARSSQVQADHCCACPLRRLPEYRDIAAEVWNRFRDLKTVHTYRPGNVLFYQGNRPLGLFFICGGRVKLIKEDRFGHGRIVRVVEAPNLLGDRAFFAERPYACSGEVMVETQACFLDRRRYWELFGQNLAVFRHLTQRFARELGDAEHNMHCLSACAVNARTATHLLMYPRRSPDRARRGEFDLRESRTELAQILGTTIEAVSRALARFCSKGWIAVEGRHVRILNNARLKQAACPHLSSEWQAGLADPASDYVRRASLSV